MDTINYYLKINKEDSAFVYNAFKLYDGLASVRTPNPQTGNPEIILEVKISPDFVADFDSLFHRLHQNIKIEKVSP